MSLPTSRLPPDVPDTLIGCQVLAFLLTEVSGANNIPLLGSLLGQFEQPRHWSSCCKYFSLRPVLHVATWELPFLYSKDSAGSL